MGTPGHLRTYKDLCNRVRQSARRDKEEWIEGKCREIETSAQEQKCRKTYMLIKDINRKWTPRQRKIKDRHGNPLQTMEEIKARWTEYCRELYTETDTEEELRGQEGMVEALRSVSPPPNEAEDTIMKEEVTWAIKKLKPHKTPGTDGITAELIQAGGDIVEDELDNIINDIWEHERMPGE